MSPSVNRYAPVTIKITLPAEDVAYIERIAAEAGSTLALVAASIIRGVIEDDRRAESAGSAERPESPESPEPNQAAAR